MEKDEPYMGGYLKTIQGDRQRYKRVSLSPLRYAGGKTNAVGLILENMPKLREKKVVSLFFGGGSLELALTTKLGFHVIGYDVFPMLVDFWNTLIHNKDGLVRALEGLVPDKLHYTHYRHVLLHHWEKVKPPSLQYTTRKKEKLTPHEKTMLDNDVIMRAAYYYFNMQLSYGPMFLGWPSSVYLDEKKYQNILERLRQFQPGHLEVRTASFEDAVRHHPNDFLFLDPPYYIGSDSKMFKGMYPNCNFAIHHDGFAHELLRDVLHKHKGGFFLTYNDCPTIRQWYARYTQVFPKWQYTFGQGEKRIGKNREESQTNTKDSHEIFIICPPHQ